MKLFISVIGAVIFSIGGLLMALGMQLISHEKIQAATLDVLQKLGDSVR